MDKFVTLEPTRLYSGATGRGTSTAKAPLQVRIGRLPEDLHLLVLSHLPVPDIPAYSRGCRALSKLARDEKIWKARLDCLGLENLGLSSVLDDLEAKAKGQAGVSRAAAPPTMRVDALDDDFGDFASVQVTAPAPDEMGEFVGAFSGASFSSRPFVQAESRPTSKSLYARAHQLLRTVAKSLSAPPHLILATLFQDPAPPLADQSKLLRLLALFLSPGIKPLRAWSTLALSLRSAMDKFDTSLLSAFDFADTRHDEPGMREAAEASWAVWDGADGEWELGRVWAEKREIFYQQGSWDPMANFTKDGRLDFDSMDEFITSVLAAVREDGARAVRVFPPAAGVLISFADRIATDVISEYIVSLLTRAREISNESFLKASAASFRELWRLVDAIMQVAGERPDSAVTVTQAEDVVYRMFETNMDEYLDEEVEFVKHNFDSICRDWESKTSLSAADTSTPQTARFLGSHNPALVKRTVLASFADVLLLPVTIVPRAAGAVGAGLVTAGGAAVQGIAMLNPQRWGGGGSTAAAAGRAGYRRDVDRDVEGATVFELGPDPDDEDEELAAAARKKVSLSVDIPTPGAPGPSGLTTAAQASFASSPAMSATPSRDGRSGGAAFGQFELLLSLDVALELIHADRESLKRAETFAGYPGHYGHRVRDTLEEIFVLFLQAVSSRHLAPGFGAATDRMRDYQPAEHEETTSVAPLLQFFELVHIGDTIQSMIQVYFDKELAPHIDRTDFLNVVVREKKKFENGLDDSVAAGLNAGTEVLMNQVEHIIIVRTQAREYYPPEDAPLELGATTGCVESIACLEMHCKLLKDSTSKEVLEVFYQEVGFRLIAILQKHIKRQIISLNGGFQLIADLNAYHAFIASLKVPAVATEFSHLKMLGHVYVVEDAKDLAQIVRDVTRYGGAYRPEDIYEFIQRRSDWKKIEKTVDKTMYNLSFKEDCVVC